MMTVKFLTVVLDLNVVQAYTTIQALKTSFKSVCLLLIEAIIDGCLQSLFNDNIESDSYHDQHNFGNSSYLYGA